MLGEHVTFQPGHVDGGYWVANPDQRHGARVPQHGGGHVMITVTDLFCGAGGSGLGATAVAGVELRIAANHWALAIQTHATNVPDTDHVVESGCRPVADVFGFCRCWALR
jgi:hypothetical protein